LNTKNEWCFSKIDRIDLVSELLAHPAAWGYDFWNCTSRLQRD